MTARLRKDRWRNGDAAVQPWFARAACKGRPTSWWFAFAGTPEAERAERICSTCPVITDCGREGHRSREWGRWGRYVQNLGRERNIAKTATCERCNEPVTLYRNTAQPPCDSCLAEKTRERPSRRFRWRVSDQELREAVAAFEAFMSDAGLEVDGAWAELVLLAGFGPEVLDGD